MLLWIFHSKTLFFGHGFVLIWQVGIDAALSKKVSLKYADSSHLRR